MQVSSPCVLPGDRQLRVVEKISGGHRDLLNRKAVEREDGVPVSSSPQVGAGLGASHVRNSPPAFITLSCALRPALHKAGHLQLLQSPGCQSQGSSTFKVLGTLHLFRSPLPPSIVRLPRFFEDPIVTGTCPGNSRVSWSTGT